MKSVEEIKARIELQLKDPIHGMMIAASNKVHPLMIYVPEYIKEGYEADPLTEQNIVKEMQAYLFFAMEKAGNQRGLSAARSMWKYREWLWALEDEELLEYCKEYTDYGLPQLKAIAEKYSLKWGRNNHNVALEALREALEAVGDVERVQVATENGYFYVSPEEPSHEVLKWEVSKHRLPCGWWRWTY